MEHNYYLGIDLDDENAIVSFFQLNNKEPETVSPVAGSEIFQIPVAVAKKKGIGQWFVGEDARKLALQQSESEVTHLLERALADETIYVENEAYPAKQLLTLYLRKLIYMAAGLGNPMQPDKLVITLDRLSREKTELFLGMAEVLGMSGEQIMLLDRQESFYYFIYNQKEELWLHDICLFDYREKEIRCHRAERNPRTVPQIVSMSEDIRTIDENNRDETFLKIAQKQFEGHVISSVYLVGDGFEGGWMKSSLSYICKGRRAFMGKNLYSKGACYAAAIRDGKRSWNFFYMGDNEMKVNVSLKVLNQGKTEFYTLISAGDNWYETVGECEVILDELPEIAFWLQAPRSREAKVEKVELSDLPKRPKKTTRIRITAKPLSDTKVQIKMKDMGFGELFLSSDKSWEYIMEF